MCAQADSENQPTVVEYMHENPTTVNKNATLQKASEIMHEHNVGALLVVDDENQYVGIVSDKRIAREGLAKGHDPATTPVQMVMRKDPISIDRHQLARDAQAVMKSNGVRHLVVKDGETIIGILTLSDLIRFYTDFFD